MVANLSFVGRRQVHINFSISSLMRFRALKENETAGLVIMQALNHQLRLERSMENEKEVIRLIQCTSELNGYPFHANFTSKTRR